MSQPTLPLPADAIATKLAGALQEAMALMHQATYRPSASQLDEHANATLLQQCLAMCEQQSALPPEPLRLVHHLACTGGTVISRCIAAMANVQLLSGMDPISALAPRARVPGLATSGRSMPLRGASRGVSQDLVVSLFQAELRLIHGDAVRLGQRLVIRDNAQSHFLGAADPAQRPGLRALVPGEFPVRAVVIVRDPLLSFLALRAGDEQEFEPQAFDAYCERYLSFIDSHAGTPIVRFEDFVAGPEDCIRAICEDLDLPFSDDFQSLAAVFDPLDLPIQLSEPESAARAGSAQSAHWADEALKSKTYQRLQATLQYARSLSDRLPMPNAAAITPVHQDSAGLARPRKRLIVVLGMHRSGTSATTRGLMTMGVELGNNLIAAQPANAKGYFENTEINSLDVDMLAALGRDWKSLEPIDQVDVETLRSKGFFQIATAILERLTANCEIFGIKDPRIALLIKFWQPVFAHCKLDVSYVLCIRNPVAVAASLKTRDNITKEKAHLLFLAHLIPMLESTRSEKRAAVDYDMLLQEPRAVLRRIAQCLNLTVDERLLQLYSSNFLDKALRHQYIDTENSGNKSDGSSIVMAAYYIALALTKNKSYAMEKQKIGH